MPAKQTTPRGPVSQWNNQPKTYPRKGNIYFIFILRTQDATVHISCDFFRSTLIVKETISHEMHQYRIISLSWTLPKNIWRPATDKWGYIERKNAQQELYVRWLKVNSSSYDSRSAATRRWLVSMSIAIFWLVPVSEFMMTSAFAFDGSTHWACMGFTCDSYCFMILCVYVKEMKTIHTKKMSTIGNICLPHCLSNL